MLQLIWRWGTISFILNSTKLPSIVFAAKLQNNWHQMTFLTLSPWETIPCFRVEFTLPRLIFVAGKWYPIIIIVLDSNFVFPETSSYNRNKFLIPAIVVLCSPVLNKCLNLINLETCLKNIFILENKYMEWLDWNVNAFLQMVRSIHTVYGRQVHLLQSSWENGSWGVPLRLGYAI